MGLGGSWGWDSGRMAGSRADESYDSGGLYPFTHSFTHPEYF